MKNWDVKKLGEVCSFFNGQAHEKCIDEKGKYKLINSKFVSSEGENFKRTNNALSPLFVNDIVMVMSDVPNGKTLAKCFVVDKNDTYTLNQRICVIRSKNFNTRFLYYQLNRNKYLLSFNNGENQTNLRKDDILNCDLFVPPLPEQQRIVSILDECFAAIDKAKANAEQNLKNAKELFESYLQGVFEKKGDGWEEKRIDEICKLINGRAYKKDELLSKGKYRVLRVGNFFTSDHWYYSDLELDEDKYCDKEDLLYAWSASFGPRIWKEEKVIYHYHIWKVIPDENLVTRDFLFTLFEWDKEKIKAAQGTGTTMIHVSKGSMENRIVPVPPLKEQQTIVRHLDALRVETQKLEAVYQKKIADLEELKKSILQKAFAGELQSPEGAAYANDGYYPSDKKRKTIKSPERV